MRGVLEHLAEALQLAPEAEWTGQTVALAAKGFTQAREAYRPPKLLEKLGGLVTSHLSEERLDQQACLEIARCFFIWERCAAIARRDAAEEDLYPTLRRSLARFLTRRDAPEIVPRLVNAVASAARDAAAYGSAGLYAMDESMASVGDRWTSGDRLCEPCGVDGLGSEVPVTEGAQEASAREGPDRSRQLSLRLVARALLDVRGSVQLVIAPRAVYEILVELDRGTDEMGARAGDEGGGVGTSVIFEAKCACLSCLAACVRDQGVQGLELEGRQGGGGKMLVDMLRCAVHLVRRDRVPIVEGSPMRVEDVAMGEGELQADVGVLLAAILQLVDRSATRKWSIFGPSEPSGQEEQGFGMRNLTVLVSSVASLLHMIRGTPASAFRYVLRQLAEELLYVIAALPSETFDAQALASCYNFIAKYAQDKLSAAASFPVPIRKHGPTAIPGPSLTFTRTLTLTLTLALNLTLALHLTLTLTPTPTLAHTSSLALYFPCPPTPLQASDERRSSSARA